MNNQRTRGIVVTIIAAIIWSTGGVLVKLITQDAFTILCYRSAYAVLFLALVFRKEALRFSKKALYVSLFYVPLLICFVTATKLTTAANAIFLQYIAPAIVLVIEPRILGTSIKRYNIIAVIVCLSGLSLFLLDQTGVGSNKLGDGLALMSGFFSAGLILSLKFSNRSEQMSGIMLGNMVVVLITLPWFLQSGAATYTEHAMLAFLGLIQIGLGYALFTYGQRRIAALESSLISMLEPILNPVWVVVWYDEVPARWSMVGGSIIIIALIVRMIYLRQIQLKEKKALSGSA